MKRIGIGLVVLVLMLGAYALGMTNASKVISIPAAQWTEGNEAAQAWREFSASLEAAGARVFAASDDPIKRIEGLLSIRYQLSQDSEKPSLTHVKFEELSGTILALINYWDAASLRRTDWIKIALTHLVSMPGTCWSWCAHLREIGLAIFSITSIVAGWLQ